MKRMRLVIILSLATMAPLALMFNVGPASALSGDELIGKWACPTFGAGVMVIHNRTGSLVGEYEWNDGGVIQYMYYVPQMREHQFKWMETGRQGYYRISLNHAGNIVGHWRHDGVSLESGVGAGPIFCTRVTG